MITGSLLVLMLTQWQVGLELTATRYGGSSHDTSGTHVASQGRPGDATVVSLRFGRDFRRLGVMLRISRAKTGFAAAGSGVNLTDKTTGLLYEISPVVSTRVGGIGPSGAIIVELGPALHLWNFDGEYRVRLGALPSVIYEWAVARRLSGAIRVHGALSKSWFNEGELSPEFERRVTWRYGVGLGLHYRL